MSRHDVNGELVDLDALRAHLQAAGYSSQTIETTIKGAVRFWRADATPPARLRPLLLRVLDWPGCPPSVRGPIEDFIATTKAQATPRALRGRLRRARRMTEARSFEDNEWARLLEVLERDDSLEGAVLGVLAATGLRIGDALGMRRDAVVDRSGYARERIDLRTKGNKTRTLLRAGAPEAWDRLAQLWSHAPASQTTLALVLTDGGSRDVSSWGAAYKRVARQLEAVGQAAGIESRLNLHRLRRTVGVQALRVTRGDVRAVQELLGHESYQTTLGYLDEAQPERVAEVQAQVRAAFRKKG